MNVEANFKFNTVTEPVVREKINSMDQKKPFTYDHIATKLLVENSDIMSPYITEMYNESKSNAVFPSSIKCADITPAYKKEKRPLLITIDLSAYFHRYLKYSIEICMIKYIIILISIYLHTYVAFAKVLPLSTT